MIISFSFYFFVRFQNRKPSKDNNSRDKRNCYNQGGSGGRRNNSKPSRPHSVGHFSKDSHSSSQQAQWSQKPWNQTEQFPRFFRPQSSLPGSNEPTVAYFSGNPILTRFSPPPNRAPLPFAAFPPQMAFYPQLSNFPIPPPPPPSANPPPPPPIPSPHASTSQLQSWAASTVAPLQTTPLPSNVILRPPPSRVPSR